MDVLEATYETCTRSGCERAFVSSAVEAPDALVQCRDRCRSPRASRERKYGPGVCSPVCSQGVRRPARCPPLGARDGRVVARSRSRVPSSVRISPDEQLPRQALPEADQPGLQPVLRFEAGQGGWPGERPVRPRDHSRTVGEGAASDMPTRLLPGDGVELAWARWRNTGLCQAAVARILSRRACGVNGLSM